jgi:hypothetical protein
LRIGWCFQVCPLLGDVIVDRAEVAFDQPDLRGRTCLGSRDVVPARRRVFLTMEVPAPVRPQWLQVGPA